MTTDLLARRRAAAALEAALEADEADEALEAARSRRSHPRSHPRSYLKGGVCRPKTSRSRASLGCA